MSYLFYIYLYLFINTSATAHRRRYKGAKTRVLSSERIRSDKRPLRGPAAYAHTLGVHSKDNKLKAKKINFRSKRQQKYNIKEYKEKKKKEDIIMQETNNNNNNNKKHPTKKHHTSRGP